MCISISGVILMVPQKHREASKFIYNSGFYLTPNLYPDFGEGLDGQAIKKRLKVFETKSLKHKGKPVCIGGGSSTPKIRKTNSLRQ